VHCSKSCSAASQQSSKSYSCKLVVRTASLRCAQPHLHVHALSPSQTVSRILTRQDLLMKASTLLSKGLVLSSIVRKRHITRHQDPTVYERARLCPLRVQHYCLLSWWPRRKRMWAGCEGWAHGNAVLEVTRLFALFGSTSSVAARLCRTTSPLKAL
jgi:hypothetical protein